MKVSFDPNIRVAGIGVVPWSRLGPEQWLPNYAIACLFGWDLPPGPGLPRIFSLDKPTSSPALPSLSTQSLLGSERFQTLLDRQLPDYDLLTYKPVKVPQALSERRFLMTDPEFTRRYENKIKFRQQFKDTVRFPQFAIHARGQLGRTEADFKRLIQRRSGIVIQDEQLSGGKGTFLIRNFREYIAALSALDRLSRHQGVVVSDMIEHASEPTIQCCVTRDAVITGPLQRQIVGHPLLANLDLAGVDKYCGTQTAADDQNTPLHRQAADLGRKIGATLRRVGYRGIFGVDFLLDEHGELFVVEVNPRIVGVTPLITSLYKDDEGVPFYLLHILELGQYDYQITDPTAQFDKSGSLLVLHSLSSQMEEVRDIPTSGTYRLENDSLVSVSRKARLSDLRPNELIFQGHISPGTTVKPGGSVATLLLPGPVIDTRTEKLYNSTVETIAAVRKCIVT